MYMSWIGVLVLMCGFTTTTIAAPKSATDKIVAKFMDLDADTSEAVSFEEYKIMVDLRAQQRFEQMDANADGEVTADEYRDFWRQNKSQWYRLKR